MPRILSPNHVEGDFSAALDGLDDLTSPLSDARMGQIHIDLLILK